MSGHERVGDAADGGGEAVEVGLAAAAVVEKTPAAHRHGHLEQKAGNQLCNNLVAVNGDLDVAVVFTHRGWS